MVGRSEDWTLSSTGDADGKPLHFKMNSFMASAWGSSTEAKANSSEGWDGGERHRNEMMEGWGGSGKAQKQNDEG